MTRSEFDERVREGLATRWRTVDVSLADCEQHCDEWGALGAGWVVLDGQRVQLTHHHAKGPAEPAHVVAKIAKPDPLQPAGLRGGRSL